MNRIAAFVGHSFADSDDPLVTRFLDFFSHVRDLGIGFEWDHAEKAEPKVLSEKVKEKMEGKNLFIGICTHKEYSIAPDKLRVPFLRANCRIAFERDLEPKTSDWITQEIGYSIAKGMKLILLLENGVRRPGGLQGDIEHIPFDRNAPSESFEKIMEMLRALGPQMAPPDYSASTGKAEASPKVEEEAKDPIDGEPDDSWNRESYERAITGSVFAQNDKRTGALLEAYSKTHEGQDAEKWAALEAYSIHMARVFGTKGSHNARLEELVAKHPKNTDMRRYLALSYESFGVHNKAAEQYLVAATVSTKSEDKIGNFTMTALARANNGDTEAESWLRTQFSQMAGATPECVRIFRRGLMDLAKFRKENRQWVAYQEARLLDFPDYHDSRNELAWAYFQSGDYGLSLYHYLLVPPNERSPAVWNNIGACYNNLEIHAKSVRTYQTSQKNGGTYAVSNLAYLLIEKGFHKEAEEICKEALQKEDCDKRVAAALASIQEKERAETVKAEECAKVADEEHRFMARLGNAFCAHIPFQPATTWVSPECTLSVTVEGTNFRALGKYEQPHGTLALLASGRKESSTSMIVSYEGQLSGLGASFVKRKFQEGTSPSLLSSTGDDGYLIIDENMKSASEMLRTEKKTPTYQQWSRSN